MKRLALAVGLVVAGLGISAQTTPADAAKRVCGERGKLAGVLSKKYKEVVTSVGVSQSGKSVLEIYVSETGTWTALLTTAKGMACILGAGHSWEERDKLAFLPKT